MRHPALRGIIITIAALLILGASVLGVWLYRLDESIQTRLAEKRFAPPVEFYSAPETIVTGAVFPSGFFESFFSKKNYRRRDFGQPLQPSDYSVWSTDQCRSVVQLNPELTDVTRCVAFRNSTNFRNSANVLKDETTFILALSGDGKVVDIFGGPQATRVETAQLEPVIFAQYYGQSPVLRNIVTLGSVPTMCLNALLAIEDSQFLEHQGISPTSLARAFITNLRSGRKAQGGSTITQQLVKNYFLTDEKTIKRKVTEIFMAFLVERHASKDDILETYVNLIYMGQNGPYEVRGFSAAAEHYFGKSLSDLSLDQCSLLAAVLNSPGIYNPFKHPERALKRRSLVIDRMMELKMIDEKTAAEAKSAPIPQKENRFLTEPAPYFVQAVRREIEKMGLDESDGLRVYTTLNLRAQEAAQQAIRSSLNSLETSLPKIKKLKESGKNLEAVLISANPKTGSIEALVGGRGFTVTQFNRAVESRRQVGSVMKPFVYLTALEKERADGSPHTPLTLITDQATTHRFAGQAWSPRNYDGKYYGEIPMFWSLKESLNAATVNLGMSVGLSEIIDTASNAGIKSELKPLPSLTLGAFELTPLEVLQAYSTIANLGERVELSLIDRIEDLQGNELVRYEPELELALSNDSTAVLVGMMKQTLINGTGRGVRLSGFTHPAAGKTGTTNDKKDAWFAGFTPYHVAVAWVGYDDNTSHGLTGASGAVPIWTKYMNSYASHYPPRDFEWPSSTEVSLIAPDELSALGLSEEDTTEAVELVFKKGQAPVPPGF